ncbi:MAG: hypothetical protein GEV06_01155 [Luteitalea sp.]|nr:hypothetical protein [Luteitalea sp.]
MARAQTNDQGQDPATVQAPDGQEPPAGQEPQQPAQPTEPGQEPAAPAEPGQQSQGQEGAKPPQLTFSSDTVMIFYQVLADKTQQFEQVLTKVKEAMQKSENPARKQQAEGMRLLKSAKPSPDGSVQYAVIVHPVMKDTEYEPGMLVYEAFPDEANKLFSDFESLVKKDGMTGVMEFVPVFEFGSGAAGGGN